MKTREQIFLEFFRISELFKEKGIGCSISKSSTDSIEVNLHVKNNDTRISKFFTCYFGDIFCYKGSENKTCQQVLDELYNLLNKSEDLKMINI